MTTMVWPLKHKGTFQVLSLLAIMAFSSPYPCQARDTDIYAVNAKQNCYILLDNSGSMAWGVYEHNINYKEMYLYLDGLAGVYDPTVFAPGFQKDKIYLVRAKIRVGVKGGVTFVGDPGNPAINWDYGNIVDTHTLVDNKGNLSFEGGNRITLDAAKNVLLDGNTLPFTLGRKEHEYVTLYDGTVVDKGFGGLLNAPGYHFSGYEDTDIAVFNNPVEDGDGDDEYIWFFATGNWLHMQGVYNLKDATGALVWDKTDVPLAAIASDWLTLAKNIDYPVGSVTYAANLNNQLTSTIKQSGALKIQVHFSYYNVGDKDYVKLYDATDTLKATYGAGTDADGFWGPVIDGDTVTIKMSSDNKTSTVGYGYIVDEIRYVDKLSGGTEVYRMQSRLDVAKEALLYVVEEFRGRMNWGYANFNYLGTTADGATIQSALNPNENDDTNRAAIVSHVTGTEPKYGTPLGEALQDVFEKGYYGHRNALDNLLCRKNYVIVVTDGYPSGDESWGRITDVPTFSDFDGDGWTEDPAQYSSPVPPDYYDDVAHWMYTHSWLDKTLVADPANSFVNVITHHIGFSLDQPLLEDAAGESGGDYITAFNKQQLVAAFYSLAMKMSGAISFTAPVVSVDAVNKIQSGDDLYMGLFLPKANTYWVGNLKKFKLGDGSTERPDLWMIYDKLNHEAIDSAGVFLDNTYGHWGNDTDVNDHDSYGAADVQEDGAGDVMLDDLNAYFQAGSSGTLAAYWSRPIYTYKGNAMLKFDRTGVTFADLAVADNATRDKLVNFVHGYTYEADAVTGAPVALGAWPLGPIVHSRPIVLDYYDTTQATLPLVKRFVAVGANDGMLHVFADQDNTQTIVEGQEVFSFIPADILPRLQNIQATLGLYDTVDGPITLYRRDKNPKYLIFGERRGGSYYWALDVSNPDPTQWTVAWQYTNSELKESWSDVKLATIQVGVNASTGARTYKDVAIFTGGYDPLEDNFPEPFLDINNDGIPGTVAADGSVTTDNGEWSKTNATQDMYNDDKYNLYNPGADTQGRGIFVVDIDNPATEVSDPSDATATRKILPYSLTAAAATYTVVRSGLTYTGSTGGKTRADLKFCFPSSPAVVVGPETYRYKGAAGTPVNASESDVLRAVYAPDIYANIFKLDFSFVVENSGTAAAPQWTVKSASWQDTLVFKGNPGSTSVSGALGGALLTVSADPNANVGRKAFYPPAISWGGAGSYFDYRNYLFETWKFGGVDRLVSLFIGTGDREHPKYAMVNDRFYSIYDDSSVSATLYVPPVLDTAAQALLTTCQTYGFYCPDLLYGTVSNTAAVSGVPYTEKDLLNLTCDDLGSGTVIDLADKLALKGLLLDDAKYYSTILSSDALEEGRVHENDAKGWYIILAKQGDPAYCADYTYPTTILTTDINARDNHVGEKILSQPILYNKILYFTSYQPAYSDACNPSGNGFSYALDYTTGAAALNLNTTNAALDVSDRYRKYVGIHGIPSGFAVITREGHAAAMASMGGAVIGPGVQDGDPGYEIPSAGSGLELFYWKEGGSLLP